MQQRIPLLEQCPDCIVSCFEELLQSGLVENLYLLYFLPWNEIRVPIRTCIAASVDGGHLLVRVQ